MTLNEFTKRFVDGVPNNAYEESIVRKHSTSGLKRNQLDLAAKREQLAGLKVPKEDANKILSEMYGDDGPPKG